MDQETSEEKLFIIARHILNSCSTDISIEVSIDSSTIVSIKNDEIRIFKFDFWPMLTCMCWVSFLKTLDIYKVYFKGRQSVHKLHKCWAKFVHANCDRRSFLKKFLCLCTVGFCDQASSWSSSLGSSEELCSQQPSLVGDWSRVMGSAHLVSHVLGAVHWKDKLSLQNKSNWVLG